MMDGGAEEEGRGTSCWLAQGTAKEGNRHLRVPKVLGYRQGTRNIYTMMARYLRSTRLTQRGFW